MSALIPRLPDILSSIADHNARNIGGRFHHVEMLRVAEAAERDGLFEWRNGGRWLTEKGRQAHERFQRGGGEGHGG